MDIVLFFVICFKKRRYRLPFSNFGLYSWFQKPLAYSFVFYSLFQGTYGISFAFALFATRDLLDIILLGIYCCNSYFGFGFALYNLVPGACLISFCSVLLVPKDLLNIVLFCVVCSKDLLDVACFV